MGNRVVDPVRLLLTDKDRFKELWRNNNDSAAEFWAYSFTESIGINSIRYTNIDSFTPSDKNGIFDFLYRISCQNAIEYLDGYFEGDCLEKEREKGLLSILVGSILHKGENAANKDMWKALFDQFESIHINISNIIKEKISCYCNDLYRWLPLKNRCQSVCFPVAGDDKNLLGLLEAQVWVLSGDQFSEAERLDGGLAGKDISFWKYSAYTSEDFVRYGDGIIGALQDCGWLSRDEKVILNIKPSLLPPENEQFKGKSLSLAIALAAYAAKYGLMSKGIVATGAVNEGTIGAVEHVEGKARLLEDLPEKDQIWRFIYCGNKAVDYKESYRIAAGTNLNELVELNQDGKLIPDILLPLNLSFEIPLNRDIDSEYMNKAVEQVLEGSDMTLLCTKWHEEHSKVKELLGDCACYIAARLWNDMKYLPRFKNTRPVIVDLEEFNKKGNDFESMVFKALSGKGMEQPSIPTDSSIPLKAAISSAFQCPDRFFLIALDYNTTNQRRFKNTRPVIVDFVKFCSEVKQPCIVLAPDASVLQFWKIELNKHGFGA
jgi:hypothetical protein